MSELPTSPEHHPLRPTLEGAAQTTLTKHANLNIEVPLGVDRFGLSDWNENGIIELEHLFSL